ncbi:MULTISPECIES: biotin-dependent carboxyltransferase family protein [unclassified Pseudomonas]|uniref:5-oxoprolinase subunit C family protein n=1 Tax=unclassified Pseudomonas TaxID=196821 RepID=UPI0025CC2BF1|nr:MULTISPECIES: biotin-dependent carboxyltransferase family protein [unclassified Pseudomonas]
MSLLTVKSSTPLCQLQDAGRFGVRHLGVTQGGALDWVSMSWANKLLNNPLDAAVIEVTLGGMTLIAEDDCCLALAGADLDVMLDDRRIAPWRSFFMRKGQQLRFIQPTCGVRAYLAAPGGFDAVDVLGSRATVGREGLGGLEGSGKALREGDQLRYSGTSFQLHVLSDQLIPELNDHRPLDVVLGAQIGQFSGMSLFDAFNSDWTLDSRADRMGMRLLGPELIYQGKPMISEGIPLGAIQVPPDGQPIVLLNDRQTIGGYPRLGAMTPLALTRLAQKLPGAVVRMRAVVQEVAHREQAHCLDQLHRTW